MNKILSPYNSTAKNIAYFISPHGFGHAARACAVIQAALAVQPDLHFHLFTTIPEWFFTNSLESNWTYHSALCDIGLVQKTAFQEDVDATLRELDRFLPSSESKIQHFADRMHALACQFVISDIAPLGLAAAAKAGLPSVLIENFTWDWIYAGYPARRNDFQPWIDYFAGVFKLATYHIQTQPFCGDIVADLITLPVSRKIRLTRPVIREVLHIPPAQRTVLVSLGGVPERMDVSSLKTAFPDTLFIIPGGSDDERRTENLLLLPHHHPYFHPDLVGASDAVVGKVGYSTISEVYWAGVPFAFISRPAFRESSPLVDFIKHNIAGIELTQKEFENGAWQHQIGTLLDFSIAKRSGMNGADQIASFLASVVFN